MPPRDYEGATASSFDSAVGGILSGADSMEKLRERRRNQAREAAADQSKADDDLLNTKIKLAEHGLSIGNTPNSGATSSSSPMPAAAAASDSGAPPMPASSMAVSAPNQPPPVDSSMSGAPGFDPSAPAAASPVAQAPTMNAGAPVAPTSVATDPATAAKRGNFLQRVGAMIGGAASSVANGIEDYGRNALHEFQTGGYVAPVPKDVAVTKTGPSETERAATIAATSRQNVADTRAGASRAAAEIHANASVKAAQIRASIAAAKGAGKGPADHRQAVLADIARESGNHMTAIRALQASKVLQAGPDADPDTKAAADEVRAQIQAHQDAINELAGQRETLRDQLLGTPGVGKAETKITADKAKASARAKEIYSYLKKNNPNRSEAEIRAATAKQLKAEKFNVQ